MKRMMYATACIVALMSCQKEQGQPFGFMDSCLNPVYRSSYCVKFGFIVGSFQDKQDFAFRDFQKVIVES